MNYWPLKAPPQIAADSVYLAATTTYQARSRPTRSDGSKANLVMLTWDTVVTLDVRSEAGGVGMFLGFFGQPYILSLRGDPGSFYMRTVTGTATVHVTPVEES